MRTTEFSALHSLPSVNAIGESFVHEAPATHAEPSFEGLVADIAVRLSAIAPDATDAAVTDCLRRVGEALHLESAVLWRMDAEDLSGPCFGTVDDLPEEVRDAFVRSGFQSGVVVPLSTTRDQGILDVLACGSAARDITWAVAIVERLRLVAGVFGLALTRQASHTELQKALDEIGRLRDRLTSDNVELRREVKALKVRQPIASDSSAIQQVLAQIEQVAPTPATVLLLGETGSGKEVMAQAIHDMSPRRTRPMIKVSCAAIPTALIESELFGRERGAYTGALSRQIGRFEAANQSTLFLDEIGELPMEMQVKLLRVLQEKVIERLGSTQSIKVDVRIIAATNRNLNDAVRDKMFREDLFYRLNVFPVVVPALRERVEDIPALVWSFVDEFSRSFGKTIDSIPKECMRELQGYPWPGNVRELRNVIERAVIVATDRRLVVWPPRTGERPATPKSAMTLGALECEHIRAVLDSANWRIRGAGGAAERLGLKPTTLESRMARLGITRKNPHRPASA